MSKLSDEDYYMIKAVTKELNSEINQQIQEIRNYITKGANIKIKMANKDSLNKSLYFEDMPTVFTLTIEGMFNKTYNFSEEGDNGFEALSKLIGKSKLELEKSINVLGAR